MKITTTLISIAALAVSTMATGETSFTIGGQELPVFSDEGHNSFPGSGVFDPYESEVTADIVAAGGTGCPGGGYADVEMLGNNTMYIDFNSNLKVGNSSRSIERKFCNLSILLEHDNYNMVPVITDIIAVAQTKVASGGYAKAAVQARFALSGDVVKVETTQRSSYKNKVLLKNSGDYTAKGDCYDENILNVKASTLLRKSRSSRSSSSAKLAEPVIVKIKWKKCSRYDY